MLNKEARAQSNALGLNNLANLRVPWVYILLSVYMVLFIHPYGSVYNGLSTDTYYLTQIHDYISIGLTKGLNPSLFSDTAFPFEKSEYSR